MTVDMLIPRPRRITAPGGTQIPVHHGFHAPSPDPAVRALLATFGSDLEADGVDDIRLDAPGGLPLDVRLGPLDDGDDAPTTGLSPRDEPLDHERSALSITADGITITAPSREGAYRSLTTLRQIVVGSMLQGRPLVLEEVEILDHPRFGWRGLSLDVVRCFFGVAEIKRVIDMLALYKMNVLHLHLTDDQGWRIEVPTWPLLSEIGGSGASGDRPGGCYTLAEFAEIVDYAGERFVSIVPEIDLPGHTGAAVRAYPELEGAEGGGSGPVGTMDPDAPRVREFVTDVLATVASVSPCPYLHIGGDEAFGVDPEAYTQFLVMARSVVRELGKVPVTWQEGAASSGGEGDVLQYWMAFDPALEEVILAGDVDGVALPDGMAVPVEILTHLADALRTGRQELIAAHGRGARILLSPASHLYLDRPYAEASVDPAQRGLRSHLGLPVYPRATVEDAFTWDPAAALPGVGDAVAGIECAMWCETVATAPELEFLLLPRLLGVAEHAWSSPPRTEWPGFAARVATHRRLWARRSWNSFGSELIPWV